ncbi:MAG: TonB-dependent receptor [Marinilabiliaceae bacterium]|nr:TonB-dependent receptor [Marinilabiliaceae bacterium]
MTNLLKIIFLFFFLALAGHQAASQQLLDRIVEVSKTSGSAEQLLLHLEEQSEVVLSYSNQVCLPNRIIFNKQKGSIKFFLDQIFETCQVEYIERNNKIVIIPVKSGNREFHINGYIIDHDTGEPLIGANLFDFHANKGTSTNNFGYFSLPLNGGQITLGSSYIGYNTSLTQLNVKRDTLITIRLKPMPALQEISVLGKPIMNDIQRSGSGIIDIPVAQIKNIPSFMGEPDIIKAMQLFPGIQSGNEGFSGLYVRGGSSDQNLILLDDVPVYNMEHLLGLFTIFNPDVVNKVSLIKGGFPAQYGGRLSSVVDIRTYDGNQQQLNGSVGIGILSSKFSLNGPLWKGRTTFSISGRRTYYDLIQKAIPNDRLTSGSYFFYDLNAKLTHTLTRKDRLYVSIYNGSDDVSSKYNFKDITQSIINTDYDLTTSQLNDEVMTGWGNTVVSGRWNHIVNEKIFTNLTTSFSDYRFYNQQQQSNYQNNDWSTINLEYFSGIRDFTAKVDIDYYSSQGNTLKAGVGFTRHQFYPGINVVKTELSSNEKRDTTYGGQIIMGNELHAYLQDDITLTPTLKVNTGIHMSMFQTGKRTYHSIEPRLNARLLLTPTVSLKASYSAMTQYIHLLSSAMVSLPTDLWMPVTEQIEPMKAWQTSMSAEWQIRPEFNLTAEVYYKETNNLIDYKDNQNYFDTSSDWISKLTSGFGRSYGLELLLHRKMGDWSGWVGYTLSKSVNRFDDINQGNPFRANNDRRHDAALFLSYLLSPNADISMTWAIGSGKPMTLADEKYFAPSLPTASPNTSGYAEHYSERNSYTMPIYHRMDIGANFRKKIKLGERTISVGIMNVYGRQNAFFLFYADNINKNTGEVTRSLKQFSLFPIPLPYVRYTLKF